ncbi:MAG TPA: hypothetical protein PLO90_00390 [Clostridia bacterium]|nr:hypothetical protein [Clostridia bacterium]HQO56109.1 hypothetical protein [Clostridia bacterium]HUM60719.1 hypothetical protein [Clostridia bacterium]
MSIFPHATCDNVKNVRRDDLGNGLLNADDFLLRIPAAYPLVHIAHFILAPDEGAGVTRVFQDVMEGIALDGLAELACDANLVHLPEDVGIGMPGGVHVKDQADGLCFPVVDDIGAFFFVDVIAQRRGAAHEQAAAGADALAGDGLLPGLHDHELAHGGLDGFL